MTAERRTNLHFQAKGIAFRADNLALDIERFLNQAFGCPKAAAQTELATLAMELRRIGAKCEFRP